jgi:uncharacterized protein (DUF362 family)
MLAICPKSGRPSRRFVLSAAATAALSGRLIGGPSPNAPTRPVALARCYSYGPELETVMGQMFDQIGGLGRIVKGKHVSIKINLTGGARHRLGYFAHERTHWSHPRMIAATVHHMFRAGARKVTLLEGCFSTADTVPEFIMEANWDPNEFLNLGGKVEMINTNWLDPKDKVAYKDYRRIAPPRGGHMFSGYDMHPAYLETDVFVSMAKLKEHATAGVTLTMKNMFGATPISIYGEGAGIDAPGKPTGGRGMIHSGQRTPSKSAPQPHANYAGLDAGGRVPRVVADVCAARPSDLAIIDGIETMAGGEGPWNGPDISFVKSNLIALGTNCVNVDAVGTALMGFDPMADRGRVPFETSDNTLRLGEELGIGTRDLKKIEVLGGKLAEFRVDLRKLRRS